jgi:hypothetical protein
VSYVAQKHLTRTLSVFGEAGAGAVAFAAINGDRSASNFSIIFRNNTFRPEGITGFGIDYRLGHGFGLRGEYRGLFIKYPDYGSGIVRLSTITSAPTLSFTYNIGGHSMH